MAFSNLPSINEDKKKKTLSSKLESFRANIRNNPDVVRGAQEFTELRSRANPKFIGNYLNNFGIGLGSAGIDAAENTVNYLASLGGKVSGIKSPQINLTGLKRKVYPELNRPDNSPEAQFGRGVGRFAFNQAQLMANADAISKFPQLTRLQQGLGKYAGKNIASSNLLRRGYGKGVANLSQGVPFTLSSAGQNLVEGRDVGAGLVTDIAFDTLTGPLFMRGTRATKQAGQALTDKELLEQVLKDESGTFAGKSATSLKNLDPEQLRKELIKRNAYSNVKDRGLRWFLSDKQANLKRRGLKEAAERGFGTLDEILNHPRLFKEYPQARNINVQFDPNIGARGSYNEVSNVIKLNPNNLNFEQLGTILHENQHFIQGLEDFARGGSPSSVKDSLYELVTGNKLGRVISVGEVTSEIKKKRNEISRVLEQINGSPEAKRLIEKFMGSEDSLRRKLRYMDEYLITGNDKELYRRLQGEAEARAVQGARGLTQNEGRGRDLLAEQLQKEGIKPEDLIVRGGRGQSFDTDPLIQEARKYKSAEEFIKSQGQPLYHGTNAEFDTFDPKKVGTQKTSDWSRVGTYFDPSKSGADYYRKEAVKNTDTTAKKLYQDYLDKLGKYDTEWGYEWINLQKGKITQGQYDEIKAATKKYQDYAEKLSNAESGRVVEAYLSPDAKVAEYSYQGITDPYLGERLMGEGYDAVKILTPDGRLDEVVVMNTSKIKTKSQLTDIWNKAHSSAESLDIDTSKGNILDDAKKVIKTSDEVSKKPLRAHLNDFYTQWVNRFHPIDDLVKNIEKQYDVSLLPSKNPSLSITKLLGSGGKAELRHKRKLMPILKSIPDTVEKGDFDVFLKARRDLELGGRNIKGSDIEQARGVINALVEKYGDVKAMDDAAKKLYAYQEESLKSLRDAGFIDDTTFGVIKDANKNYVPFQRVMDELDEYLGVPSAKLQQSTNPLQKIKGSDRPILSPLESIVANTYKIEAAISKNKVAQDIVDLGNIDENLRGVFRPLRTAENVRKRIEIYTQLKSTNKYKNSLGRAVKTKGKWVRRLGSEIDKLNYQGLEEYLKDSTEPKLRPAYTKIKMKPVEKRGLVTTDSDSFEIKYKIGDSFTSKDIPLRDRDIEKYFDELVQEPQKLRAIKRKIGTRSEKLTELLDEWEKLGTDLREQLEIRGELRDTARELADITKRGNNKIAVWRDGIKEYYEAPEDIVRAVKGLNEEQANIVIKIASAPARLLRQGATGRNIDFMIPNVFKDQFDAAIGAKYGYTPFVDYFRGLAHLINYKRTGSDELVEDWINNGGQIFFENMGGRKAVAEQIKEQTAKGNKRVIRKLGEWAIGGIDTIGEFSEVPTRLGVYNKARRATGNSAIAAREAREATVDFARMGAKMKTANSLVPFLNVGVQGFDKLIRTAKNNPKAFALRMTMYGLAPALTLATYNNTYHKEEYSEIPSWEKDTNFIVVTGRDEKGRATYLKFPKGNVLPYMANPVEEFVSYLAGSNERDFKAFALNFLGDSLPVVEGGDTIREAASRTLGANTPQIMKPSLQAVANYDFFRTRPIVGQYEQNKPKPEQYRDNTPEIYKRAGLVLNQSPLKLQNFTESTLGTGYSKMPLNTLDTANALVEGKEVDTNKIPVARRFLGVGETPDKVAQRQAYKLKDAAAAEVEKATTGGFFERLGEALGREGKASAEFDTKDENTMSALRPILKDHFEKGTALPSAFKDYDEETVAALAYNTTKYLDNRPTDELEARKYDKELLQDARNIYRNEDIPTDIKNKLIEKHGYNPIEVELDVIGNSSTLERAIWIKKQLQGRSEEEAIKFLRAAARTETLSGDKILTQAVADELGIGSRFKTSLKAKKKSSGRKKKKLSVPKPPKIKLPKGKISVGSSSVSNLPSTRGLTAPIKVRTIK